MIENNQINPQNNLPITSEGQTPPMPQEKFEFEAIGNQQNLIGPKFETSGGWGEKSGKWLKRNFSKIVLPIIIVLILAGGFAFFGKEKTSENQNAEKVNIDNIISEIKISSENNESTNNEIAAKDKTEQIAETKTISSGNEIVASAEKGDGVTHLARKALAKYLEEKGGENELTKEHKIYIEDYLKDKVGSKPLNVGDKLSFSEDLITQAIDSALGLSAGQLKNLEQFSKLVPSL